jgi:hypothetical protein
MHQACVAHIDASGLCCTHRCIRLAHDTPALTALAETRRAQAKNVSRCAGSKENLLAHLDTHAERLRPLWEAAMRRVAPAGQLVPPSLRPVELKAADSHECLAPLGGGEPLPKKKRGRPPKVKPAEKAFLAGAAAVAEAAPVFAEKEKAAAAVVESAEKAAAEGAGAVEEAPHCAEAAEPGEKGAQAEDVENATLVD